MKRQNSRVIAFGLALALCMLGGCSAPSEERPEPESTQPATENTLVAEPEDLEVIESGWSTDSHGYTHYGVGVRNPNADFEAQSIKLTATGRDADGKIVFTRDDTIPFMLPGAEYYLGGQAGNGTAPDSIEFSLEVDDRRWVKSDHTSSPVFEIGNANEVVGEFGQTSYTGELSANLSWDDTSSVRTSVILRDSAGAIVYGTDGYIDYPAEGQARPFELHVYEAPEHATYELNALPFW